MIDNDDAEITEIWPWLLSIPRALRESLYDALADEIFGKLNERPRPRR